MASTWNWVDLVWTRRIYGMRCRRQCYQTPTIQASWAGKRQLTKTKWWRNGFDIRLQLKKKNISIRIAKWFSSYPIVFGEICSMQMVRLYECHCFGSLITTYAFAAFVSFANWMNVATLALTVKIIISSYHIISCQLMCDVTGCVVMINSWMEKLLYSNVVRGYAVYFAGKFA